MSLLPQHLHTQLDEAFCGRSDILNTFRILLGKPVPQTLCIWGQDGIGKSWLLYQMMREAEKAHAVVAWIDRDVRHPLDWMQAVGTQLARQGVHLQQFNDRLKEYHQTRQEALKDMQIPFGFYSLAGGISETTLPTPGSSNFVSDEVDGVKDEAGDTDSPDDEPDNRPEINEGAFKKPPKGPIEEKAYDQRSVDQALGTIENLGMAYLSWKINDLEKTIFVVHPEEALARVFLEDLNKHLIGKRLVILLDDYETNRIYLDAWLSRLYRGEMGKLPPWLLVAASRDEYPEGGWHANAVRIHLTPFNQQEVQAFLRKKKIHDNHKVQMLGSLSGNLPLWLGLLTAEPDILDKFKGTLPPKLLDSFFSIGVPENLRSAVLTAALPRRLNRAILDHILGDEAGKVYDWLKKQPFVYQDQQDGMTLHPTVRTRLVQKMFSENLTVWREIHSRLDAYYSAQLPKTAIDESAFWKDQQLQQAAREAVYHQLCASGVKYLPEALNTFLDLLDFDPDLADDWARAIRQAGSDTLNRGLFNWGQRLFLGLQGLRYKNYPAANAMFTVLAQYPGLDPRQVGVIHRWRAEVQRCLLRPSEAIPLFDACISEEPEDEVLFALRGEAYRQVGDYESAVKDFKRALQIKPECAYSLSRLGEIYRQMALYDEALKNLNLALELTPSAAGLLALRADILRHNKRLADAMDDLNHALVLKPDLVIALAARGDLYLLNGKLEEALRDIERALELRPDWCWAIACRGAVYQKMGFNDFAIRDYSRALEMNNRYASVLVKRATTYRQIDQNEEALEDLNKAILLMPNDPALYALRGELYQRTGNYEESLADFNKAIELDPNFVGGIAARGATYRRMAQYAEALQDFNRAAELDPSLVAVVANQGEMYRKMGKYEEALECFSRGIEYKPDYIWAIAGRGETYRKMKRYHDALVDFDRVIELDPSNPWAYAVRGMTYRLMEQYERALADFNLAIGFNPNYHGALALRGETYRRLKNLIKAIKDFSRALDIRPDNWTFSGRGEALYQIARYPEALADFNLALAIYPRDTYALTWRARTYQKMKRYSKALEDYSMVIDFDPNDDELRLTRAFLYQYTGNDGLAYQDFEKAIEIAQAKYQTDPMNVSNMLHLALYCLAVGDYDQADAMVEEALAGQLTQETLEEILEHMADFLYVFPDHKRAKLLQQMLLKRRS